MNVFFNDEIINVGINNEDEYQQAEQEYYDMMFDAYESESRYQGYEHMFSF